MPDSSPVICDLGWPVDFAQHYVKVGCDCTLLSCLGHLHSQRVTFNAIAGGHNRRNTSRVWPVLQVVVLPAMAIVYVVDSA